MWPGVCPKSLAKFICKIDHLLHNNKNTRGHLLVSCLALVTHVHVFQTNLKYHDFHLICFIFLSINQVGTGSSKSLTFPAFLIRVLTETFSHQVVWFE